MVRIIVNDENNIFAFVLHIASIALISVPQTGWQKKFNQAALAEKRRISLCVRAYTFFELLLLYSSALNTFDWALRV